MAYYKININRVDFGVFCADSKSEALDACAREAEYTNQIDYEHYLLDNAAQAAGYRDWDDWGAAGPEAQRPDPEKILDDEIEITETDSYDFFHADGDVHQVFNAWGTGLIKKHNHIWWINDAEFEDCGEYSDRLAAKLAVELIDKEIEDLNYEGWADTLDRLTELRDQWVSAFDETIPIYDRLQQELAIAEQHQGAKEEN